MLAPSPQVTPVQTSIRRHINLGGILSALLIVGVGSWATLASLSSAVIAPATLVVENSLRKVQHPTGGVVGDLRVHDGDSVKAGDILLKLDETITRANLGVILKQIDELSGRRARLIAERDGATGIVFPEDLLAREESDADISTLLKGERLVFEARLSARQGQKAQLKERISQSAKEVEGLEAQLEANRKQIVLIKDELVGVSDLYRKNLVPISRINPLQREGSRLEGEQGQLIAAIAQSKIRRAETELQIIQIDQDLRTEVLKDMREMEAKLAELAERRIAAEDQLKRIDIRAPIDGVVHQLTIYTVGGVVGPGEILMMIVPQTEALTVEAKIAPQDIDQVVAGRPAFVRFVAFNQRSTPELTGKVTRVSADLTRDPQANISFYTARVELDAGEITKLGTHKLVPGMPVEVHIHIGERSALSYFLRPLTDNIARAFKEK